MENKLLTKASVLIATSLIATFLLAIPITPSVLAVPTANVSVTPGSINADFGGTFTASVNVSNAQNLAGYDLRLQYNPNVLTASTIDNPRCLIPVPSGYICPLTGTLFDPANGNVLIAKQEILQTIGLIRFVGVILGGTTSSPSGGLLSVKFQVNSPGSSVATASDYPSDISVSRATLVANIGGSTVNVPYTTSAATYMPPSDIGYQGVGCGPQFVPFFDTTVHGLSAPVFCNIVNTGTQGVTVRGDFSYRSLRGLTGTLSAPSTTLSAGQAGQVTSSLILAPQTIDIFLFTGQGTRLITFSDGSVLTVSGAARHFAMIVYTTDFTGEFSGQNG